MSNEKEYYFRPASVRPLPQAARLAGLLTVNTPRQATRHIVHSQVLWGYNQPVLRAVYYPHTAVRDRNFLKHALLYWDEIEYISPGRDFDPLPDYSIPRFANWRGY